MKLEFLMEKKKYKRDNMPATVTIVRPNITREEETKAFERISCTLEWKSDLDDIEVEIE